MIRITVLQCSNTEVSRGFKEVNMLAIAIVFLVSVALFLSLLAGSRG